MFLFTLSTDFLLALVPIYLGFPSASVIKNPPANAGDTGDTDLIPGSERSPGGGDDNPLQYSCLENPMDRGAWLAIVHKVARAGHDLGTKQQQQ